MKFINFSRLKSNHNFAKFVSFCIPLKFVHLSQYYVCFLNVCFYFVNFILEIANFAFNYYYIKEYFYLRNFLLLNIFLDLNLKDFN